MYCYHLLWVYLFFLENTKDSSQGATWVHYFFVEYPQPTKEHDLECLFFLFFIVLLTRSHYIATYKVR